MKNQKLRKVPANRHIPSDLIPEILSRLPVKSLLRFRCVSKSWLNLVDDDAEFARLHLKNFKNNSDETHLLVVHNSRQDCVVRRSDTFKPDSGTIHSLKEWNIVCSVNGLILLRHSESSADLKLWNPSIRKFRELPSLSENEKFTDLFLNYHGIGLGYDPLAKDYKIVVLFSADILPQPHIARTPRFVAIYTLGDNSLKIIEFQVKGSLCSYWSWGSSHCRHSLYFQGGLYFVCCDKDLLFFDLSTEVFSSVSMPVYNKLYPLRELALVDGGCSLAILDTIGVRKYSIWVLETGSMSWMNRYSFRLKFDYFLHLRNNGEILVRGGRTEKNTPENGEKKKLVRWDQVISYNPETDEYKIVHELRSSYYKISRICGYVESLILHK